MSDAIRATEPAALARVGAATSVEELRAVSAEVLGKRGTLTDARKQLADLDPDARREAGKALNEVRARVEEAIALREAELAAVERRARLEAERLDLTETPEAARRGHLHLITQIRREVEDVFLGLGYRIVDGREVETTHYNFDALNFPHWHPARSRSASQRSGTASR